MNIAILGAALDTGNLGVSALAVSILEAVYTYIPDANVILFDYKKGLNRADSIIVNDVEHKFQRMGMIYSKRVWQYENIKNISFSMTFKGFRNPISKALKTVDLALDITGGDSFTDLYGKKVFKSSILRKKILASNNIPYVLLPQTYGPFSIEKNLIIAKKVISSAMMVWARDDDSFNNLKKILGSDFDEKRHLSGVDVAFLLRPVKPKNNIPTVVNNWIEAGEEVVGINVNGYVYNHPDSAAIFGHKANYKEIVNELISKLITIGHVKVVLVPHVHSYSKHFESDDWANEKVYTNVPDNLKDNVYVLTENYNQNEIKYIISQMHWFCGTRMHSTIASLSSSVPTVTIAYSLKALGVFQTVNQENFVADLRKHTDEEILDIVWRSFLNRKAVGKTLTANVENVKAKANAQMKSIFSMSET